MNEFGPWDQFVSFVNRAGFAWKNLLGQDRLETWTPRIAFGSDSTGVTYNARFGKFYVLGKLVFLTYNVQLSSKGGLTGEAQLRDLPIAVSSTFPSTGYFSAVGYWTGMTSSLVYASLSAVIGTNQGTFYGATAAATGLTALTGNDWDDDTQVIGYITYPRD